MSISFWGIEGWQISATRDEPARAIVRAHADGDEDYRTVYTSFQTWLADMEETREIHGSDYDHCLEGVDLTRQQISCREQTAHDEEGNERYFWECDAEYRFPQQDQPRSGHKIGDIDIRGASTGRTANIKYAVACTDSAGDVIDEAKKLVNWNGDPDEPAIEGVDVVIPSLQLVITRWYAASALTAEFARQLAGRLGMINEYEWYGFDKGEAKFSDVDWQFVIDREDNEAAEIKYVFDCIPNRLSADGKPFKVLGWGDDYEGLPTITEFEVDKRGWEFASMPYIEKTMAIGGQSYSFSLPSAIYIQEIPSHDLVDSPYLDFDELVPLSDES